MQQVFRFMYALKYDPSADVSADDNALLVHLRVATAADKYNIPVLQQQAIAKFKKQATKSDFEQSFVEVIKELGRTDEFQMYRSTIIDLATVKVVHYRQNPDNGLAFWEALESVPMLAVDLLRQGCGDWKKIRGML